MLKASNTLAIASMKNPFPRLLVCFFLLLAAGCSTIQSRIEQRQDVFNTLSRF